MEWWRPRTATARPGAVAVGLVPTASASVLSFRALIAFTLIMCLSPQTYLPGLAALRIALLTGGIAIGALLIQRLDRGQSLTLHRRETAVAALLGALALASVPGSLWPGASLGVFLETYIKSLVVLWLIGNTVDSLPRLRTLVWTLVLLSVPLAGVGLAHYQSDIVFRPGFSSVARILGYDAPLTSNPNDLALMLNMIWPLAAGLLLATRTGIPRLVLAGVITLNIGAVIVTFSRSGFLTLAATVFVYLWRVARRPQRGWAVVAVALMLLSLPFLPAGYTQRIATIGDTKSDPSADPAAIQSKEQRWSGMTAAVALIGKNPVIGAGLGMDVLALNAERGPEWTHVHNVYLQYGVDLGLPGVIVFVWLLVLCLRAVHTPSRPSASLPGGEETYYLAEGIQMGLVAFMAGALFEPVAYNFYFYFWGGLALAVKSIRQGAAGVSRLPTVAPGRSGGNSHHRSLT
jgi:O-antigen ligase